MPNQIYPILFLNCSVSQEADIHKLHEFLWLPCSLATRCVWLMKGSKQKVDSGRREYFHDSVRHSPISLYFLRLTCIQIFPVKPPHSLHKHLLRKIPLVKSQPNFFSSCPHCSLSSSHSPFECLICYSNFWRERSSSPSGQFETSSSP